MRNLSVAAGLSAIVLVVSQVSFAAAASYEHRAGGIASPRASNVAYSTNASAPMSRADDPVPPNCIRQSCGKLWCWQMKSSAAH